MKGRRPQSGPEEIVGPAPLYIRIANSRQQELTTRSKRESNSAMSVFPFGLEWLRSVAYDERGSRLKNSEKIGRFDASRTGSFARNLKPSRSLLNRQAPERCESVAGICDVFYAAHLRAGRAIFRSREFDVRSLER